VNEDAVINENKQRKFSVHRYLVNIVVRMLFFLFPVPLHLLDFGYSINEMLPDYFPIGVTILLVGGVIGGVLDILLPQKYVVGGRIALRAFNIATLAWFEAIDFKVKVNVNVDAGGKGIAIKDHRE